jgi:hypothetical protein
VRLGNCFPSSVYFNGEDDRIWLLIVYAKAKFDRLPTGFLARLKREVEYGSGDGNFLQ